MTAKDSSPPHLRSAWRDPWVWGVTLAGLLLRLVYVLDLPDTPFFAAPQMDALYHDQWARRLAGGAWWGSEVFFRAPLYPYFLGLIYATLGTDPLIPRLVQAALGAGTVMMTQLAARPRLGRAGATVAGLLVALYAPLVYFEGELLLVVLEAPLFLATAWSLDRAWGGSDRRRWGIAGAIVGAAALARPTILAVAPVVAVVLLLRRGRGAWGPLIAYAAALVLVLTPVLVRNYVVGGDLVPVASQGGLNYYLGNNPDSDGMAALAPRFRSTWSGGVEDARLQAETALARELKPSEISRYWYGEALNWARSDPGAFIRHQLRKLSYFWDAFEIPNNQDYYFFSRLATVFSRRWPLEFTLLGPLALLGLGLGLARRRLPPAWGLVPLILVAVIVAFFVCGRFRAGLIPLFALWGALGLVEVTAAVRRRQWRTVVLAGVILVAGVWVVDGNRHGFRARYSPAESHLRLGIHYASTGESERAEAEYRRAVQANPGFADGWNNLGSLLAGRGDFGEADRAFQRAVGVDPRHAKALGNLAALRMQQGDRERAIAFARRAVAAGGYEPDALRNAAVVLGNAGLVTEALEAFQGILALQPGNAPAVLGTARALGYLGRPREALEVLGSIPDDSRNEDSRLLELELRKALGGVTPEGENR